MPASIGWHPNYADNNVILIVIESPMTLDEVINIPRQESDLIRSASHTVHTIVDSRHSKGPPDGFLSQLPEIAQMPTIQHPFAGEKVVVGATEITRTFLEIFSQVYRKIHMVETMDEARALIDQLLSAQAG